MEARAYHAGGASKRGRRVRWDSEGMGVSEVIDLRDWNFNLSQKPDNDDDLLICYECATGSPISQWNEGSSPCEECGSHDAIVCPECGHAISSTTSVTLDVAKVHSDPHGYRKEAQA